LYGKKIVVTGFRPKELMDKIVSLGGEIGSSVSKKTFAVLVKSLDEDTGKAEQARQLGVSLMTAEGFKKLYNL
jgi:NAD-dependent DNA ligase